MINRYIKVIALIVIPLALLSCSIAKQKYYSYEVDVYGDDSIQGKRLYTIHRLISYGDYLFESKILVNVNAEIFYLSDSGVIKSVTYSTNGVFLLSGKKQQYYEFDSFALNSKLLKQGNFSDKPSGMKLSPVTKTDSTSVFFGPPREVSINNIQCFYSDIISKDTSIKDLIEQKVILIKKKHFNSFYRLMGVEFTNKEYCIIGFRIYNSASKKNLFVQELKELRPLTEKEKQICKSLIKASKL